ncbi:hypothetical protein [Pseudoalteromonas luteoviolacea]|nr:hypothetical protein [Pseudoalteromonas luteoviolacea]AOT08745.1 hypothetical protein S4054249_13170 [Pseudoalteromonas luteoviolacea]AOT13659.1 hypothetical protein S40542_13140 [Pseudoalteromonas luteoviolacea]AOT18573.1 hypothetical protein S4054_13145 [Pseudoalteromonas luteoviolacea]
MFKILIQNWENNPQPLVNENGYPIKSFEVIISKCSSLNKKAMKSVLKDITNKTLTELELPTAEHSLVLSLADLFVFYGANIKVVEHC